MIKINKHLAWLLLLTCFALLPVPASAAILASSQDYAVKPLGIDMGLSSNYCVAIERDKWGYLWIATEEGLNRFDGSHFYTYYQYLSPGFHGDGLGSNALSALLDDTYSPVMWVATQRNGLNAINYADYSIRHYTHQAKDDHSIGSNDLTGLARASDGGLWVCTYWNGVDHFNTHTGQFTHYCRRTLPTLPSDQVWCALDGGHGFLYVGHVYNGLSVIDTHSRRVTNYNHRDDIPSSISGNEVHCLFRDRMGHLWIGTNHGLDLFDPIRQAFLHFQDVPQLKGKIMDIRELGDNRLWIATELQGIVILDISRISGNSPGSSLMPNADALSASMIIGTITEGSSSSQLTGNGIRSLCPDAFGNVWVGLYGSGMDMITQELPAFTHITYSPFPQTGQLTNKNVFGLAIASDGSLWAGTDGSGVNVFNGGGQRIADMPATMGSCVQTIYRDHEGRLWTGSYTDGGKVRETNGTIHAIEGLPAHADVRCYFEDNKQQMWIATSSGLYRTAKETNRVEAHWPVKSYLLRAVYVDDRGYVWLGTFGNGFLICSPSMRILHEMNETNGFPSSDIYHIQNDHRGHIWIATNQGLVCMSSEKRQIQHVYDRRDGMESSYARASMMDADGNLWVSTNKGISCLRHNTRAFINYSWRDNLPKGNFNDGSVCARADGTLFFGSTDGIVSFLPQKVLTQRRPPKVFITGLSLPSANSIGQDSIVCVIGKKQITVDYHHTTFSILFSAQDYALSHTVEYAYQLEGLHSQWALLDDNKVTLHDLPYGHYKLLVRCRLRNQQWSAPTVMELTMQPPFWLSWWAKTLYALMVLAVVIAAIRLYLRKVRLEYLYNSEKREHQLQQKITEERLQFFTNIAHELRTPLTLILGPLDDMARHSDIPQDAKHTLAVVFQSAQRLKALIDKLLEFRKTETANRKLQPQYGNLVDCVRDVCLKYEELNRNPNVVITTMASQPEIMMNFDKDVVTIILDNLISNAVKYTDRGHITIAVSSEDGDGQCRAVLTVSDTGRGISSEALPHIFDRFYQEQGPHQASGTGIGLALVKNLVGLHHGTITVESKPGKGSVFRVVICGEDSEKLASNTLLKENGGSTEAIINPHTSEGSGQAVLPLSGGARERLLLLVVEDDQDIREFIASVFTGLFDVRQAKDGEEGWKVAQETTPDIIISDIMMPRMDGNELCRKIKNDVRTSHIPVILLTAKDTDADKTVGYNAGADSYLTKPFTVGLLRARVDNLLRQRQQLNDTIAHSEPDFSLKRKQLQASLQDIDRQFFQQLDHLIEERISGDVDVSYLAEELHVSVSTLYRKMKTLTGISTNEYIRKYKMQYAEHLLLTGRYSISEVSFMVGMSSPAYFRRCFKEAYGMIPSEYIQKMKEEKK